MRTVLALSLLAFAAAPAVAGAAAKPGSYAGTSSGKYVQIGAATEPTDKGKVAFSVTGGKVSNFKVTGQLFKCGPAAEVPFKVKTIRLSASGKGTATYKDPNVGPLTVSITVTSAGRASGTIRAASGNGICDAKYPVRFTAKRR